MERHNHSKIVGFLDNLREVEIQTILKIWEK